MITQLPPTYLVQTADKCLHGYNSVGILLCDLARHKGEPVTILKLNDSGWTVRYSPITEEQLREKEAS